MRLRLCPCSPRAAPRLNAEPVQLGPGAQRDGGLSFAGDPSIDDEEFLTAVRKAQVEETCPALAEGPPPELAKSVAAYIGGHLERARKGAGSVTDDGQRLVAAIDAHENDLSSRRDRVFEEPSGQARAGSREAPAEEIRPLRKTSRVGRRGSSRERSQPALFPVRDDKANQRYAKELQKYVRGASSDLSGLDLVNAWLSALDEAEPRCPPWCRDPADSIRYALAMPRCDHAAFRVANLDRSIEFYTRALPAKLVDRKQHEDRWRTEIATLQPAGQADFVLVLLMPRRVRWLLALFHTLVPRQTRSSEHLGFRCDSLAELEACAEAARAAGGRVRNPLTQAKRADTWLFEALDPDGNAVEWYCGSLHGDGDQAAANSDSR